MKQIPFLIVHGVMLLGLLIICGLFTIPLKRLFHTKIIHTKDNATVTNTSSIIITTKQPSDVDFRSLKQCPYNYLFVTRFLHLDNYDENCLRFFEKKLEKTEIVHKEVQQQKKDEKVKTEKVENKKMKSAKINTNVNRRKIVQNNGKNKTEPFPYAGEVFLKMVLIGLFISMVVDTFNALKKKETVGPKSGSQRRSSYVYIHPKYNNYGYSNINCNHSSCHQSICRNNEYNKCGYSASRPISIYLRPSNPTDTHSCKETCHYNGYPDLRIKHNTLFRRR